MKTKYLFCAASLPIDLDTVFIDVWVGTTARDQRDCAKVAAISQTSCFYFQKWSKDVQTFWDKVCNSVTPNESSVILSPRRVSLSVSELRRLLLSGTFSLFCEKFVQAFDNLSRIGFSENSAHLSAKNRASVYFCNAVHVKNLKLQTIKL